MPDSISKLAASKLSQVSRTNPLYARVYFGARRRFELTIAEAVLCDVVTVLSRKTGWCFASRAYLTSLLGVSERSLRRMLTRLTEKGLIERHQGNERHLRVTMLWITENQADDVAGP